MSGTGPIECDRTGDGENSRRRRDSSWVPDQLTSCMRFPSKEKKNQLNPASDSRCIPAPWYRRQSLSPLRFCGSIRSRPITTFISRCRNTPERVIRPLNVPGQRTSGAATPQPKFAGEAEICWVCISVSVSTLNRGRCGEGNPEKESMVPTQLPGIITP